MRINIGRNIWFLALLPLLLIGCATGAAESKESGNQIVEADMHYPGEDWKVRFIELEADSKGESIGLARTGNRLFIAFNKTTKDAEIYPLYYLSDESLIEGLIQIKQKQILEDMFIEMPSEHQPLCLFSDEEKNLYLLVSCDTGEATSCFLYKIDAEQKVTQRVDITSAWQEAFGEEHSTFVASVDENGFVYIGAKGVGGKILVVKEDGSLASVLQQQDFILHGLTSAGGQVYCVGGSQNTDVLFQVDVQKQGLETIVTLPDSRGIVTLGSGQDNAILYGYYDGVYQYDLEEGKGEDIYAWTNAGLDGRNIKDFFMDEQGDLWVLPELKEEILVMMLLQNPLAKGKTETEIEIAAEKETIVICGDRTGDIELAKTVGKFNATNEKYHVEIRDYDDDRLMAEMITGKGPDLIPLERIGISMSADRGLVEDLNRYLKTSKILSRDMLNERVLELYTVDGKLTCIPPSFYIKTLFGKKSELGTGCGWTMEEFLDYVEKHRGLTVMEGVMKGDSRMIMVMMMWYARQQQWIDWEQRKAKFDDGEFEELLRYAAAYEAKYDGEQSDVESRWRDGKILLYSRPVINIEFYLQYQEVLAGDMVAIGYPTKEGTPCNILSGYGMYGISTASTHKDGAWAFIEYLVSSQTGQDTYQYGIATLNSAMEDMLEQAGKETEEKKVISGYAIPAATDDDIMRFRELLDHAAVRDGELAVVNEILTEEMDTCFWGGRSVEETVDVIQNRVQLYLDENG